MHIVIDGTGRNVLDRRDQGDLDSVLTRGTETRSGRSSNGDRRNTGGVQRPSAPTTTNDEDRSARNVRRKAGEDCALVAQYEGLLPDGGIDWDCE